MRPTPISALYQPLSRTASPGRRVGYDIGVAISVSEAAWIRHVMLALRAVFFMQISQLMAARSWVDARWHPS